MNTPPRHHSGLIRLRPQINHKGEVGVPDISNPYITLKKGESTKENPPRKKHSKAKTY